MRDDLLDAKAAVDWAEAQIPILQERLMNWQRERPYEIVPEPDPADKNWEFLVAYLGIPLDPLIHGDVGAIINSARTALDILMSALLAGHGIKPNSKAHFPIRKARTDFLAAVTAIEDKQWISSSEAATIKHTKAYDRGDHVLYPIHQLDILRKHERLLTIEPFISQANITAWGADIEPRFFHLDNKTILFRLPRGRFRPTEGNSHVTAEIFLNEPSLGVANKPAIVALRFFTMRIKEFITSFPGN
jgi:hypothetical protein